MHLVPTICNLLHSYVSFSGYFDICRGISVLDLWGSGWNLIVNKVQSFVYVDNKRFAIIIRFKGAQSQSFMIVLQNLATI